MTYSTHRGQSLDGQQPIKEPSLKIYHFLLYNLSSLIRDRNISLQSFSFLFMGKLCGITFLKQQTVDEQF